MVTIRHALPSDLDQLHVLEQMCSQNPWTRGSLAAELDSPDSLFIVLDLPDASSHSAQPESQLIGFACSRLIVDELQIFEVAVHPSHRNAGLGSILITHLSTLAAARGVTAALLEVRLSNHSAIRLYEKCGFKRDGIRREYYGDGEDAALMSRAL